MSKGGVQWRVQGAIELDNASFYRVARAVVRCGGRGMRLVVGSKTIKAVMRYLV